MKAAHKGDWCERPWKLIANVRGRRGESDLAYLDRQTGSTLLVMRCQRVTGRRLRKALAIQGEGDFAWIVIVPKRGSSNGALAASGIEILDEKSFLAWAIPTGLEWPCES